MNIPLPVLVKIAGFLFVILCALASILWNKIGKLDKSVTTLTTKLEVFSALLDANGLIKRVGDCEKAITSAHQRIDKLLGVNQ